MLGGDKTHLCSFKVSIDQGRGVLALSIWACLEVPHKDVPSSAPPQDMASGPGEELQLELFLLDCPYPKSLVLFTNPLSCQLKQSWELEEMFVTPQACSPCEI